MTFDPGSPQLAGLPHEITGLRALCYTWVKVAELLQISISTLYRHLKDHGVSPDDYSDISPLELDEVVHKIKTDHPNDGEVLVKGHLSRLGIKVLC